MKKLFIVLLALAIAGGVSAQESKKIVFQKRDSLRKEFIHPDSTHMEFTLPDSLAHMSPWRPDYRTMEPMKAKPVVSMSSVVVIQQENLPSRITVIDNNTLRLGRWFNVSNGQAWNRSPYPDAYLDARTLSFPMPR